MERTMNILLYLLALGSLFGFGIFGVFSYFEKEKRAVRLSVVFSIGAAALFLLATLLSLEVKMVILGLLAVGLLGMIILSLLPVGKV